MTKTSKNDGLSTFFLKFLDFRPNVIAANHYFASLDTPGDPEGVKVVYLKNISAVLGWWHCPSGFFYFYQNVVQCWYGHQRNVFDISNSHNFKSFTKIDSLKPYFWNSATKNWSVCICSTQICWTVVYISGKS